jgi:hypothetical protein
MKQFIIRSSLALGCAMALAMPASANYQSFFGEDVNPDAGTALETVPNSDLAHQSFRGQLQSTVGTQDFESSSILVGTTGPLDIFFGTLKATLQGGGGIPSGNSTVPAQVASVTPGTSLGGAYSIPSLTSSKFWLANAGSTFEIDFHEAVAAFGFYATDLGDNGASVSIVLVDANGIEFTPTGLTSTIPITQTQGSASDGSAFFFGFVAGANDPLFNRIRIRTASDTTDTFGFDNFTVARRAELVDTCTTNCPPPPPVPEPGSLALFAAALAGLGFSSRRRRR